MSTGARKTLLRTATAWLNYGDSGWYGFGLSIAPATGDGPIDTGCAGHPGMKLKALNFWEPQEWKADTQILAPEDALNATDVSASIPLNSSDPLALTVIHNGQTYAASVSGLENLAKRLALVISGASLRKNFQRNRRARTRIRSAVVMARVRLSSTFFRPKEDP